MDVVNRHKLIAATPFAGAQGVPPIDLGATSNERPTRVLHPVQPARVGNPREDALLAWVQSAGRVRDSAAIEFEAIFSDSVETSGDDCCDTLDAAVGALVDSALL